MREIHPTALQCWVTEMNTLNHKHVSVRDTQDLSEDRLSQIPAALSRPFMQEQTWDL